MPGPELSHTETTTSDWLPVGLLILLATAATLAPHPANVSPIGAIGLFAGAQVRSRFALLTPVIVAFLADFLGSGLYNPLVMLFVYAGYLSAALLGRTLLARRLDAARIALAAITASLAFFLLSNFGNWLAFYPWTPSDLVSCYLNGVPYLWRTLLGNLLYAALFFGTYSTLQLCFYGRRGAPAA